MAMSKEELEAIRRRDAEYWARQHYRGQHIEIEVKDDGTLDVGSMSEGIGDTLPAPVALKIAHLIIARQPALTDDEQRSIFGSERQEHISQHIWLRFDKEEMSALSDDSAWSWSRQDALKLAYEIIKKYGAPDS